MSFLLDCVVRCTVTVDHILFTAENGDPPAIARHTGQLQCSPGWQWLAGIAEVVSAFSAVVAADVGHSLWRMAKSASAQSAVNYYD
jgi:hypothetical protein